MLRRMSHLKHSLHSIPSLLCLILLSSCETPKPGKNHAVLTTTPRSQWIENYDAYAIIKSVDGKDVSGSSVKLTPGMHRVTLTARRDVGANAGGWAFGLAGAVIGAAIDSSHSDQFARTIALDAKAGRTYIARVSDNGRGYTFYIQDKTTGQKHSDSPVRKRTFQNVGSGTTQFLE
jgi:hypothetical protein